MDEMLEENITSTCPYCHHKNQKIISVLQNHTAKEVITCDRDEGGCNSDYVINANCIIQIEVFSLVSEQSRTRKTEIRKGNG